MNRGFIGTIFLIIIGLAALKYFLNWSIFDALDSEQGRATLEYLKKLFNYLKELTLSLWSYLRQRI
ncbi:MAG: hypothetical protein HYT69_00140 [Candidatus Zambryskibacteria bacterium]|nr:hypothetical protein [Candidatus Zambryskibacteria bacterium]